MSRARAYLDHNATAPLRPAVAAAMARALTLPGNPVLGPRGGSRRPRRVEAARGAGRRARWAPGPSRWSSPAAGPKPRMPSCRALCGGAAAAAPRGSSRARPSTPASRRAIASRTGPSRSCRSTADGVIDLRVAGDAPRGAGGPAASWSRSRPPTTRPASIQPLADVAALARAHGRALVHTRRRAGGRQDPPRHAGARPRRADAVGAQARRRRRASARWCSRDGVTLDAAFLRGGGQERGLRGGTENLPAIVGFGEAAEIAARPSIGEAARLVGPARPDRGRRARPRARRRGVRRGRPAPAQHAQRSRCRAWTPPAALIVSRSRRRRGVVGLGLLVRQGRALARARRDGRRAGPRRRRAARQPRLEHGGRGCGMLPRRLRTGLAAPI